MLFPELLRRGMVLLHQLLDKIGGLDENPIPVSGWTGDGDTHKFIR